MAPSRRELSSVLGIIVSQKWLPQATEKADVHRTGERSPSSLLDLGIKTSQLQKIIFSLKVAGSPVKGICD